VSFSGNNIFKSASATNSSYFTSSVYTSTSTSTKWKIDGNSSFPALDVNVDRGFPAISLPTVNVVKVNSGLAFKISDYVINYDSASFMLAASPAAPFGFSIQKIFGQTADSVRFTKAELTPAYPTYQYLYLTIKAFNYSNKTVSNKKCVFELSNKSYNKPMSVTQ
jgi:hypothetical protein